MTIEILKSVIRTKQKLLGFYSWQLEDEPEKAKYTKQIQELEKAIEILNKNRT